jgi:hypothetical protein
MIFDNKSFRYRNFRGLDFNLVIVIDKELLVIFNEDKIQLLENELYMIFKNHPQFIEEGMKVGISILDEKQFPYYAQIRHWKKPDLKKCHVNINAQFFIQNPNKMYQVLVHEITHWHDRAVSSRWMQSHMVSEHVEVNLISMILHSLRNEAFANLRMFYAKAEENQLFDNKPHRIIYIGAGVDVDMDYLSYVREFKVKLLHIKKELLQSQNSSEDILKWVTENHRFAYFLGAMMFYLILFYNMARNHQSEQIQIFLDKKQTKRIDVNHIGKYLHRKRLYFGKVPLNTFEFTFNEVKKMRPAKFFILYLESCKKFGLYRNNLLIFEEPEIELILKHRNEIDKELEWRNPFQ